MSLLRPILALALGLLLVGCSTVPVPAYKPPIDNTETLLKHPQDKLAVGNVQAGIDVPDIKLSVRASALTGAGPNHTFSTYLQEALTAELTAAGRFDAAAPTQIEAVLTQNELDSSGFSKGTANLGARFVVIRDKQAIYNKTLTVQHEWESSILGGIAIPRAIENYPTAVQKLVGKLFADPDFVQAVDGSTTPVAGTKTP